MTAVFLGLGSNIEREHYLAVGLDALQERFGALALSSVYDSAAIGFEGDSFFNMVVGVDLALPLNELATCIREIEVQHGRPPNAVRYSSRQLDIDILTYGDLVGTFYGVELPREEITENAFVLRPLAELAPQVLHPALGVSYSTLWANYDQGSQQLKRIDFSWQAEQISSA